MSAHNIRFDGEISKTIPYHQISYNMHLICSVECLSIMHLIFHNMSKPTQPPMVIMNLINNQRTNSPVNAYLISWPSKAQNIHNLENIW